jgi:two-component system sporulation sensor kinase A
MKGKIKGTLLLGAAAAAPAAWLIAAPHIGMTVAVRIGVAAILAAAVGFLCATVLARPLERLLQGLDTLQSGHLDYRMGLDSKDEFGTLARGIERLAGDLLKSGLEIQDLQKTAAAAQQTERDLRDREEHYRRLFEYSNDAVFIYDFDGKIIDVNNKACQMLGLPREELLAVPFLNLQTDEELGRSKEAFRTSTKTGSLRFESIFRHKNGNPINVEISSSIVDLKRGIMQSIVSNITDRKAIENSLRDSEEKFRTFMETATDLMFITDAEANFTYVNGAMLRTLGYAREELIGMPFAEVLDKDRLPDAHARRRQLSEGGEDLHQLVWETKTRKKIMGEMKATAIYDSVGRFQGMRGVFRDITERKKVEESQRLAELGKLASDMAHEVNNQIAIIATRAQVAKLRLPKEGEVLNDLAVISGQCDQIKDIVKRLLLFSKPSRGDFKSVNLNEAMGLVVHLVKDQFEKHGVRILTDLTGTIPPVKADEKQLQEVFMNLLRNAFEAMPQGGEIRVSSAVNEDMVRIEVADTGSGISESDLLHIFDPFFTTKETGTGLGLSVCYGIVQAHRGDLKYQSKLGEGTTASVLIPIEEP